VEEVMAETSLDEIVQLRGCRKSSGAVGNEGTEAKVIHVCMVVIRQRLMKQLAWTVTDQDAGLRDDTRMGHEDDVPKGLIPLAKTVVKNGVEGGADRKHVRGLEELGNIQGPGVKSVTEAARDVIRRGITAGEATSVVRVGAEAEVRVAVIAICHAMADQNHVPRPDGTGRDVKTPGGRLEETFLISGGGEVEVGAVEANQAGTGDGRVKVKQGGGTSKSIGDQIGAKKKGVGVHIIKVAGLDISG
jgi:hypothetical protein